MKKVLLICFLVALSAPIFAQTGDCNPNPQYQDSLGVFPQPYVEGVSPGIEDTACVNTAYQTDFTIIVSTFTIGGSPLAIDSLVIEDVSGLPAGLTYKCGTDNCTYYAGELGCASVYGIVTDAPGDYSLTISGKIFFNGIPFNVNFPNQDIAPGEYLLTVREEGDPSCTVVSSVEAPTAINAVSVAPNPFTDFTQININATEAGNYQFAVTDLLGKVVSMQDWNVNTGDNAFTFDGSNLAKGVYIYTLGQGKQVKSGKLVITE